MIPFAQMSTLFVPSHLHVTIVAAQRLTGAEKKGFA